MSGNGWRMLGAIIRCSFDKEYREKQKGGCAEGCLSAFGCLGVIVMFFLIMSGLGWFMERDFIASKVSDGSFDATLGVWILSTIAFVWCWENIIQMKWDKKYNGVATFLIWILWTVIVWA